MFKMVSEYGNEFKFVDSVMEKNALIQKGWHEEKPPVQAAIKDKAEVKKDEEGSDRTENNIRRKSKNK